VFERHAKTLPVLALDRLPLSLGSWCSSPDRNRGVVYLVNPIDSTLMRAFPIDVKDRETWVA